MDNLKIIDGKTENPFRKKRGIVANGYLLNGFLIDAPEGADLPKAEILLITHEHCDHFISAWKFKGVIATSKKAAESIMNKRDHLCLCSYVELEFPEIRISKELKDGDLIEKNGDIIEVISTPGHTEGSVCYYHKRSQSLFSGDTIFPDYIIPNTNLPTGKREDLISSYEKLLSFPIKKIFPGHGNEIENKDYIEELLNSLKRRF